jgi:hypothetical protein
MRSCKSFLVTLFLFFALLVGLGTYTTASAACRDACYQKCGTNEKCLVPCLKNCGGDNIPPVSPPQPVKK